LSARIDNSTHASNAIDLVEKADESDIAGIQRLLNHYAAMGDLLPRTKSDIIENLEHFRVIRRNQVVVACGSLEHFTDELAEVRSLMVAADIKGGGLGRKIVENLIETAKRRCVGRIMALTYVPQFFHKLGFITVNKRYISRENLGNLCKLLQVSQLRRNCRAIKAIVIIYRPLSEQRVGP